MKVKELKIIRYQSDNKGNDIFTFSNEKIIKVSWFSYESVTKVPKKYMKIMSQYFKDCIDFINSPKYMENLEKSLGLLRK